MADPRKLGKLPPRVDLRTLKLARYLTPALTPPPAAVYWSKGFPSWGMMLNGANTGTLAPQGLGCCTIAGPAHADQVWKINSAKNVNLAAITIPDSVILGAYENWDGYVDGDPSTDNGGVILDVLNDWRQSGLGGHKITAFAVPDPSNVVHIKQGIVLFGLVIIGFNVPQSAMDQNAAGQIWDVVSNDGGIVGGHCVAVPDYNPTGPICITWGMRQQMTWAFWAKYCDESYALLSPDWLNSSNFSPEGISLADLQSDLQNVTSVARR